MKAVVVLLAVLLLVWLVLGSVRRRGERPRRTGPSAASPRPAPAVEGMVACAHCGVHLPASQALVTQDLAYCSAAHRDAGSRPL